VSAPERLKRWLAHAHGAVCCHGFTLAGLVDLARVFFIYF
jgi:hypothetical protein